MRRELARGERGELLLDGVGDDAATRGRGARFLTAAEAPATLAGRATRSGGTGPARRRRDGAATTRPEPVSRSGRVTPGGARPTSLRDHVADPGEPRPRHDGPRPPSRPDRPGGSRHARDPAGPARRGAPAGSPEPRRCRRPSTAGVGARRRAPEVRHGAPGRRRRRRAAQLGPTHRSRPRRPRGRDSAPDPRSGRPWVGAEGATPKTAAPTPHPIPPGAGCAPGTPRRVATRRADVRRQRAQRAPRRSLSRPRRSPPNPAAPVREKPARPWFVRGADGARRPLAPGAREAEPRPVACSGLRRADAEPAGRRWRAEELREEGDSATARRYSALGGRPVPLTGAGWTVRRASAYGTRTIGVRGDHGR